MNIQFKTPLQVVIISLVCCMIFACTTVNNNTNGPDCSNTSIIVSAAFTNSSNSSSTGTISISSPLGSEYTYKINSGTYQSSPNFINLAPGNYILTAKNGAGCTGATNIIISSLDCAGTTINVLTNTTTNSITVTNPTGSEYSFSLNGSTFQSSPTFSGLSSGTYTVIAKNNLGCTGATSVVLTSFDCSSANINVTATTSSSSISVTSPVGSQYTYSLNGGSYQTSPVFNGLPVGNYNITAKDNNGCTGSGIFSVINCFSVTGRDTGTHTLFIDALNPGLSAIRDTLDILKTGNLVTINSSALGRFLSGTISCNDITLDSLIFSNGDTLRIPTTTLPVDNGIVKIWGIRAGGTGTVIENGLTTKINIAKGSSNITSPINLSNLSGLKMNLRGTFLKLP